MGEALKDAINRAVAMENLSNGMHKWYVVWSVPESQYKLTDRMPMLGKWYSSDGVMHG